MFNNECRWILYMKQQFIVTRRYTMLKGDGKILANIIYNKPTKCNSGSIMFIKNYKYAVHVSDALCVHLQEHYKL